MNIQDGRMHDDFVLNKVHILHMKNYIENVQKVLKRIEPALPSGTTLIFIAISFKKICEKNRSQEGNMTKCNVCSVTSFYWPPRRIYTVFKLT